jgi:hypothetical protein
MVSSVPSGSDTSTAVLMRIWPEPSASDAAEVQEQHIADDSLGQEYIPYVNRGRGQPR